MLCLKRTNKNKYIIVHTRTVDQDEAEVEAET